MSRLARVAESDEQQRSESQVLAERRAKLERLRDAGIEPFPHEYDGRSEIAEVRDAHEGLADGEETEDSYRVAGRIAARRGQGKAAFLDLVDATGKLQMHARADVLGERRSSTRLVGLDLGDIVGVEGTAFKTRRGELSLKATAGPCSPRACARRPTSSTGWPTPSCATATASST